MVHKRLKGALGGLASKMPGQGKARGAMGSAIGNAASRAKGMITGGMPVKPLKKKRII